jgi:hypothetical protein
MRCLLVVAGLMTVSACTTVPGAPGTTPALDSVRVSGAARPVAECAMGVLQRGGFCNSRYLQFGVTVQPTQTSSRLTCYRVRSRFLEPIAGSASPVLALATALFVENDAPDETNDSDPVMTVQFSEAGPQALDAAIWLESDGEPDKEVLGAVKNAVNYCGGQNASALAPAVATPPDAAARSGSPGLAPPLMIARVAGTVAPLAQCVQAALEKSEGCTDLEYTLGAERVADGSGVNLVCYNTTPSAVSTLYGTGYGLAGYVLDDRDPADATNTRPRFYTLALQQLAPGTVEARAWLAKTAAGDDFHLAKFKAALTECGGAVEVMPAASP